MNKVVLALLLPILSVNAGTLDDLKNKPASKYEVGKIQLELGAFILNDKFKGERVKGTDFKIKKFSIEEEPSKIFFKLTFVGKAKDLTPEVCKRMSEITGSMLPKENFMKDIWSGLTIEQYDSLSAQFLFKTELVSKENENFKISC